MCIRDSYSPEYVGISCDIRTVSTPPAGGHQLSPVPKGHHEYEIFGSNSCAVSYDPCSRDVAGGDVRGNRGRRCANSPVDPSRRDNMKTKLRGTVAAVAVTAVVGGLIPFLAATSAAATEPTGVT